MRIRLAVTAALLLTLAVPARAEDDAATAIIKSAMGKGLEVGGTLLAGLLYDTSCKSGNSDPANKFICNVLAGVSGRVESEHREKVEKKLEEISASLRVIENGQKAIKAELEANHAQVLARFDQVAKNTVAMQHLTRIEGLWEKFTAQFDAVDADVTRDGMVTFAKDVLANNLHTKLADLNALMTKDLLEGQPLLRYPFYEFRMKQTTGPTLDRFAGTEMYDFAERKFVYLRASQQKAFVMYLWAATVMETLCEVKQQCTELKRSTTEIKADFTRYTRQQAETFNAAVDWLLLANSNTRASTAPNPIGSPAAKDIFLRANIVTAGLLMPQGGRGLWGRVFSMGDKWDGAIQVTCGGTAQTLKPVFSYNAPVGGLGGMFIGPDSGGPLDWWISSQGNSVYDEVRFSDRWRVHHYSIPAAAAGPCSIATQLPGNAGVMPWVESDVQVKTVKAAVGDAYPFGSFVALQRAGGTYALASGGGWKGSTAPTQVLDGKGQRENVVYEWLIEPDHPAGPWVGLLHKARAEFKVSNFSSRIHNRHQISIRQDKAIKFPDNRSVRLSVYPGNCKGPMCAYGDNFSVLLYNVDNNDSAAKKGKLDAVVGIYFDPSERPLTIPPADSGLLIDKSYGKTGERKSVSVDKPMPQSALVKTKAGVGYHLMYHVYFDLETEGRGTDASEYTYRALLAPGAIYLTIDK